MTNETTHYIEMASSCETSDDFAGMFANISAGLVSDPFNPELYLMLGNFYLLAMSNPYQALLCYENALLYCTSDEDRLIIEDFYNSVSSEYNINLNPVSIVIVSYNAKDIMIKCIDSIRQKTCPSTEIIVVDNASTDGVTDALKARSDIKLILNECNAGFGEASNQGLAIASAGNDIFFLNNDTIMTDNALFWLRMCLYDSPKNGAVGPFCNYVGNNQTVSFVYDGIDDFLKKAVSQNIPEITLGSERIWLSGYAMLIKHSVLDETGGFDTSYKGGFYEDNDLSLRIIEHGYGLYACSNSVIYHYGSTGFKKDPERTKHLLDTNRELFISKHNGIDLNQYSLPALNIIQKITRFVSSEDNVKIFEINCKAGATMSVIKDYLPNAYLSGCVENATLYTIAGTYHPVFNCDFSHFVANADNSAYDIVIEEKTTLNDNLVESVRKILRPNGKYIFTTNPGKEPDDINNCLLAHGFNITEINRIYQNGVTEATPSSYIVSSVRVR